MADRADPTPEWESERKKASLGQRAQLTDVCDVLVTSTTDAQEHPLVRTPAAFLPGDPCNRMGRFQCGDDPLESAQKGESRKGLVIRNRDIRRAPGILQVRVLWPNPWIVQAR